MSSSMEEDEAAEEEVQFVSEAPLRPVLECIDIASDSDEDGCSTDVIEDKIERQKAQVNSTLDRLMRRVAAEKRERADKCKAFKEKQMLQRAHGRQELAFAATERTDYDAKRCVDMWLKMPGARPGVVSHGRGRQQRSAFPSRSTSRYTCPVINCGKVFDNIALMEGHLKRFDHSPCDPTLSLKGCPSEVFACAVCPRQFETQEAWKTHVQAKVSSQDPGGHDLSQTCLTIVCYACPACYLLFNLRDECLQHMGAKNHFTQALALIKDPKGRALPVPIPSSAKSRLIDLCSVVDFNVRCNECRKTLTSHQEAQAHFNVYCRQGHAIAQADKTVAQVMKQLRARGQCALCCEVFLSQRELESHRESTQHDVAVNQTVEMAVLQFCRFSELQRARRAKEASRRDGRSGGRGGGSPAAAQRKRADGGGASTPAKRQKLGPGAANGQAWFCECALRFPDEAAATKHLMAANQLFHQCGVCGKLMGDLSITRLHMCRFHGGAHLSNFLYHCRPCRVDMPRSEDILNHVADAHSGHTYIEEREVPPERDPPEPSTSGACRRAKTPEVARAAAAAAPRTPRAPRPPEPEPEPEAWMCRMCEETFPSEAAAGAHCADVASHSFQRFVCGHCPQKFFKESTVRRHCRSEHGERVAVAFFCGLCDSMQFEREEEFRVHYERLHSKDYYRVDDRGGDGADAVPTKASPAAAGAAVAGLCPCMGSEKCDGERKAVFTRCMKGLSAEAQVEFVCTPCGVSEESFARIKTHVYSTHDALGLPKTFHVVCKACLESFESVPIFHEHFHSEHCLLAPCLGLRRSEVSPSTQGIKPDPQDDSDEDLEQALALSTTQTRESPDLEEALKRSLLEY